MAETDRLSDLERYRGVLLGTAVGDALGAPLKGRRRVTDAYLADLVRNPGELRYTDDTHLAIGLARSLLACGGFDGAHLARTLADHYAAEPWRGYSHGLPEVFGYLERGTPWDRAASTVYGGEGSSGSGAAGRVAPVALFAAGDLAETALLAEHTARITHTHPEGIDGAITHAVAIASLLTSDSGVPVDGPALVERVRQHAITDVLRHKLAYLHRLLGSGSPFDAARELGNGAAAHASVPTALYAFLSHSDSFSRAMQFALSVGGDTDTIAALTGALAGARLGASAIPAPWQDVEGAHLLVRLADDLRELRRVKPDEPAALGG